MGKKAKTEAMESLRSDVQALADAFWSFKDAMLTDVAVRQAENQVAGAKPSLPAEPVSWTEPTEADVESGAALLAALGHPQRMRIAMMLSGKQMTVNDLVAALALKTTGAAYHHLNVLSNAGIVEQPQRGTFTLADVATSPVSTVLVALFGEQPTPTSVTAEEEPKDTKKSKKKSA